MRIQKELENKEKDAHVRVEQQRVIEQKNQEEERLLIKEAGQILEGLFPMKKKVFFIVLAAVSVLSSLVVFVFDRFFWGVGLSWGEILPYTFSSVVLLLLSVFVVLYYKNIKKWKEDHPNDPHNKYLK